MTYRNANRPGYKKTKVGWIPEEWECAKLGTYLYKRTEGGIPGLPTFSVTINNGMVRRDSLERKSETSLSAEEHLLVKKGDIAYNMMRMWQGASGLASQDGIVSPAYIVLGPKGNISSLFASYEETPALLAISLRCRLSLKSTTPSTFTSALERNSFSNMLNIIKQLLF